MKTKIDINVKEPSGYTPLMKVALRGYGDICRLLIENGADVNVKSRGGYTALKCATEHNNKEICQLLRKYGAKE